MGLHMVCADVMHVIMISLYAYQSWGDGGRVHRCDDAIYNNVAVQGQRREQASLAHCAHRRNNDLETMDKYIDSFLAN